MDHSPAGYCEIEHTADWELEVWAPDIIGLFEQSAQGMYKLCGARLSDGQRYQEAIDLQDDDWEGLLVLFLSELLYFAESKELAFDRFDLVLSKYSLTGNLYGAGLSSLDKEIKAVTYHNLKIKKTQTGLKVRIVFDV